MSRAQTDERLLCPLCEYDVRGLTQPRCPECGHQFDWANLRRRVREKHPFLFETHQPRTASSFVKTHLAGWRPAGFFTLLRPSERVRIGWLLLYWLLTSALLLVLCVPLFVRQVQAVHERLAYDGALSLRRYQKLSPNDPTYQSIVSTFGSLAAYSARVAHPSWSVSVLRTMRGEPSRMPVVPLMVSLILWPFATFAALMLCRASLSRARIRPSHLLRCAIYSCDAAVVFGALLALLPADHLNEVMDYLPHPVARFIAFPFLLPVFGMAFIFRGYVAYRLWQAHKRYLRLPHALPMAVASQVIIGLSLVVYAMWAMGW